MVADHPEPRPAPEKIRADIAKSDCVAALLTRRKELAEPGKWTAPTWVHNEIGIAHDMKKPVIAFLEDGIDAEGLVPWIADYVRFDRTNLGAAAPRVARFLMASRALLVPQVAMLEELPTVRALAIELRAKVERLMLIERKLSTDLGLSSFLATVSGRVWSLPQDLQDVMRDAYAATAEVDAAVNKVKSLDEPRFTLKKESEEAKRIRQEKREIALRDLASLRDEKMPIVAKAAAAFLRIGFPDQESVITFCDNIVATGWNSRVMTPLLDSIPDEGDHASS